MKRVVTEEDWQSLQEGDEFETENRGNTITCTVTDIAPDIEGIPIVHYTFNNGLGAGVKRYINYRELAKYTTQELLDELKRREAINN